MVVVVVVDLGGARMVDGGVLCSRSAALQYGDLDLG